MSQSAPLTFRKRPSGDTSAMPDTRLSNASRKRSDVSRARTSAPSIRARMSSFRRQVVTLAATAPSTKKPWIAAHPPGLPPWLYTECGDSAPSVPCSKTTYAIARPNGSQSS